MEAANSGKLEYFKYDIRNEMNYPAARSGVSAAVIA
jgi:hypothetical protein